MRRRIVRSLALAALFELAVVAPASAGAGTIKVAVLRGDGIDAVSFGQSEQHAASTLHEKLGKTAHPVESERENHFCGYDAVLTWPNLTVLFDKGTFVGYQATADRVGGVELETGKGLVVGATLATVRTLYAGALRTSSEQGGAFFVTTSTGRIDGFLSRNPLEDPASARVLSIGAGTEGCPAMEP